MARPLTTRENEILEIVANGKTNGEVAMALGITEKTVKNNLLSVFTKLDVRNRVEAALSYHKAGPWAKEALSVDTPESSAFKAMFDK